MRNVALLGATGSIGRQAIEVVVDTGAGPLRVMTTHLEYSSAAHRAAQIERLRALHAEACAQAAAVPSPREDGGPFQRRDRPRDAILTGDFNLPAGDPLHDRLCAPFDDGAPALHDAWRVLHGATPHPPSFRLYDADYPGTPYCCDFVFVAEALAPRLKTLRIDANCQASDHQPVVAEFSD